MRVFTYVTFKEKWSVIYLDFLSIIRITKIAKHINYLMGIVVLVLVVGMEHLALDSGIRPSYRTNAIRLRLQQQEQRQTLQ